MSAVLTPFFLSDPTPEKIFALPQAYVSEPPLDPSRVFRLKHYLMYKIEEEKEAKLQFSLETYTLDEFMALFNCREADVYSALDELELSGYEYDILPDSRRVVLSDPLVKETQPVATLAYIS
ncbi:MAG: hypothetical protein KTR14_08890 [Vampirovibrio sp.]|nr:hypothetical protein [Vampirovibrio sp.]